MIQLKTQLTLEEFLTLPEGDIIYELIDGEAVPKFKNDEMVQKFFHRSIIGALFILLSVWAQGKGRVVIEWAIKLTRNQQDWVPVADLTYVSYNRLSADWLQDEACPIVPELVIEIISPGQTFGEMTEKATDYLKAKVQRVWIIDTKAKTIIIFYPDILPKTKRGTNSLEDSLFEGLQITPQEIFQQAKISN
ncbi:MAG: Uma2 family endonuclease [Nostoc sp. NMS1]|uniref:Uma2 family endonuclease n=1 Tax=unclassified Nostoc TaxID=2593658 RepID=UPI0025F1DAF0|nr:MULTISPECIES: Uma2 family endonuclease [unclassified Nostoc]MBN3910420.1 Uma2 family endonuclease [Nostoc sp. NMS1]MBN3995214.1 Uma2 family endonuclease [Nostoc sp. NMS2]